MLILIYILVPLIIALIFFHYNRKKLKSKKIAFIGPRGTGKTTCLYKLCKNQDINTVPTLLDYEAQYKQYTFYDFTPKNTIDLYQKFNLVDKEMKYFFFIKTIEDLIEVNGFDVTFVSYKDDFKGVVCLKQEPIKLWEFIK